MPKPAARTPVPVVEVFATGPAHGGGIGQYLRYLLAANETAKALDVRASVDPRGPGHWISTLWRTPLSMLQLCRLRMTQGAVPALHVHIAGRLSTFRKVAVLYAAHALGFRTVVHYHEYGYAAFFASLGRVAKRLVGGALRGARAHIVLGESEAENLPPLLGVHANAFVVLPNGAPSHLLGAPRSDAASGEATILFVGALSARKGVEDLLKAAAQLPATLPPWRLVFCGAGDIAKLTALGKDLGIGDRLTFKGQVANPDVRALMANSRIFILPSYAEGLSIALLEAMALGCAVVATEVGEQAQVLRHERNALVVTAGDVDAIASALSRLIEDAELSARLGVHAREDIAAGFTIERNLSACAAVLAR